jgi:hypothetical protein
VVGIATLVVVAGGCNEGGSTRPTATAARELRAAARLTLAEPSFRVRIAGVFGKQHFVASGRYLAPDRTQLGSGSTNRIIIGDTMYQRFGDAGNAGTDPALYYRAVVPATGRTAEPGSDLTAVLPTARRRGSVVSQHDGRFWMMTPGNRRFSAARLSFRVAHRRVTDATISYTVRHERQAQKYHYFDFGAPISIEAPPAALTRDMPTAPPCPTVGSPVPDPTTGVSVCSDPAP